MESYPTETSGLTLINKVIEFKTMTHDTEEWSLEKQKDNEPRYVRLQQLESLLELFLPENFLANDLKTKIESVLNGRFISSANIKIYGDLFKLMEEKIDLSKYNFKKRDARSLHDLSFNYQELMRYKIRLNKLIGFNSGIMETSYPYLYSMIVSNNISNKIDFQELDNFLWTVVDPQKRIFSKKQLIKNNNYPDKDLFDIDIDWM